MRITLGKCKENIEINKKENKDMCIDYTILSVFRLPCEYQIAQPFEYRTNGRQLVFLGTGWVFKWSV